MWHVTNHLAWCCSDQRKNLVASCLATEPRCSVSKIDEGEHVWTKRLDWKNASTHTDPTDTSISNQPVQALISMGKIMQHFHISHSVSHRKRHGLHVIHSNLSSLLVSEHPKPSQTSQTGTKEQPAFSWRANETSQASMMATLTGKRYAHGTVRARVSGHQACSWPVVRLVLQKSSVEQKAFHIFPILLAMVLAAAMQQTCGKIVVAEVQACAPTCSR